MKNILNEKEFRLIEKRIQSLTEQSVRQWGKMQPAQMLAHCSDQVRLALGQKEPHEKPTFINRNIARYVGLWLPRIPIKNMKAPVDMDQQYYGTVSLDIETEKSSLIELLMHIRSLPEERVLHPHPMFGKLNRRQWGRFMFVHIDHHLRQFGV
jgi:hypothetical protein